MVEELEQA
jgi:hypothetical protein